MWQHLTFGGRYIFTSKIFLERRELKKVTGALSGEYGGCSIKYSRCSFKTDLILPAL